MSVPSAILMPEGTINHQHATDVPNRRTPHEHPDARLQEEQYEAPVPSTMDRLVQASLALVLEPIFEADFKPVSYGFRPRRRAQDAIAEIVYFGSKGYQWVLDADITACFDELAHCAILQRVGRRIGDKRVLALIKAFLKAGIMAEGGQVRDATTGTPRVV